MTPNLDRSRRGLVASENIVHGVARALSVLTNSPPANAKTLYEVSKISLEFRRQLIDRFIKDQYGLEVQSGPFRGMKYVPEATGSLFSPMLLGTYESEISFLFEEPDKYDTFIDLGCAEGYFAVGALVASPKAKTIAFDLDPVARNLCGALAEANNVEDRIQIREMCDFHAIVESATSKTLVLVDIEGAEEEIFKGNSSRSLMNVDLIIETHDTAAGGTLKFLHQFFHLTHDIRVIEQEARDPSVFPPLMELGQFDRFMAQWEGRGPEPWIFAQARR